MEKGKYSMSTEKFVLQLNSNRATTNDLINIRPHAVGACCSNKLFTESNHEQYPKDHMNSTPKGNQMQMAVAKLQDALKQFLADGMLTPECIIAFAHTEQDDPGQLKVFPIDREKLAIVGNAPGCPPMLVMTGRHSNKGVTQ